MIVDRFEQAGRDEAHFPGELHRATLALERAFLGGCMTACTAPTEQGIPGLSPGAFVTLAHGIVWRAIRRIIAADESPDLTRVIFELGRANLLVECGGAAYVAGLLDSTDCSQLNVYGRLIAEAHRARERKKL
jgi:replicative DNA helicase